MKEVTSLKSSKPLKARGEIYWKYPLFAALLTIACFCVMLVYAHLYPFGDNMILASDMEAQYAPFLFLFKRHITGLDVSNLISSFTYSNELGMGKNFMGTFGYYLASPLNFIAFMFEPQNVAVMIDVIIGIKLSLAAAFMCIFIHERATDKKAKWPILFGVMYAFSSYTMVFMMHFMWLDAYYLLPLLLFFIEKYLSEEKKAGLIVTLILLFLSNYYMAYMAGIFSFIYMSVRMIDMDKFKMDKKSAALIGKFILIAVLCALTVCVILLPVGLDTIRNADPTSSSGASEVVKFSAIDLIDQIFLGCSGDFGSILPANPPFIFISLMTTLSCVIYFVSDVFKGRTRIIHAVCLVLVYVSLAITAVDNAWHVFDEPNWFSHRQSYVFLPFFLILTLKVIEKIKEVSNRDIFKSTAILLALLFVAQSFGEMKARGVIFLVNLCMIIALSFIFAGFKVTKWPDQLKNMNTLLPFILSLIVVFEVFGISTSVSSGVSALSVTFGENKPYAASILAVADASEASRIIAEKTGTGTRFEIEQYYEGCENTSITSNGAFYCGYNGISFFNSNSNKVLHRFFKQLGYTVNYNYFTNSYTFAAPDTDAFLSMGSFVSRYDYSYANYVMDDTYDAGFSFYYYDKVLPLGFAVDNGAMDFDYYMIEDMGEDKEYFTFRNLWYESMFEDEYEGNFYVLFNAGEPEVINGTEIDLSGFDAHSPMYVESSLMESLSSSSAASSSAFDPDNLGREASSDKVHKIYRNNDRAPILLNYSFEAPNNEELYMCVSFDRVSSEMEIYVNGQLYNTWSDRSFYSPVIRLGAFEEGETVEVTIYCNGSQFNYSNVEFAYFDSDNFDSMLDSIDITKVNVTDYSNGHASFECNLPEGEMLLTTIPYEDGWTAYVDGKECDIISYQDALIAVDVGSGSHTVELKFIAPGFKAGAALTAIGVAGLIVFCIVDNKKKTVKTK